MSFRKSEWLRCTVLILATVAIAVPQAAARVRIGGVAISGQFVRGPFVYPPSYFYGPYYGWPPYYDVFWTGAYSSPLVNREGSGKVLLQNAEKDASVYIDGAYAGRAGDLKSLRLQPGVYELEVRGPQSTFHERIYVLTGKTLKLDVRSERQ